MTATKKYTEWYTEADEAALRTEMLALIARDEAYIAQLDPNNGLYYTELFSRRASIRDWQAQLASIDG